MPSCAPRQTESDAFPDRVCSGPFGSAGRNPTSSSAENWVWTQSRAAANFPAARSSPLKNLNPICGLAAIPDESRLPPFRLFASGMESIVRTLSPLVWCVTCCLAVAATTPASAIEAVRGKEYKLTPKHGPWMIMVASFRDVKDDARKEKGLSMRRLPPNSSSSCVPTGFPHTPSPRMAR